MPYDIGKLRYWEGKKLPLEMRRKISKSLRRIREQRSIIMKKAFKEGRLKAPWKGKHLPLSLRLKISETKKKQSQTPAARKATSKFFKNYWKKHPKKLKEILNKTIFLWKRNKKLRAIISKKISEAGKRRFSSYEERRKVSLRVSKMYKAHPNLKEEQKLRMEIYYILHPNARKRLYNSKGNPFDDDIKTLSKYMVRSEGERDIADFLFSIKIAFLYEEKPLYLPESVYIPDFWLPEYNCFIEFFGQYPRAQKTKLEKYKLYRKYKIPCIFITPSELVDLRHYLMSELRAVSKTIICRRFKLEKWQNPITGIEKISSLRRMASSFPRLKDDIDKLEIMIEHKEVSETSEQVGSDRA